MRFRSLLLCLLTVPFLATTSFGLHAHEAEDHDHGSVVEAHSIYLASEWSETHLAEHLLHGDMDVGTSVLPTLKWSLPPLFVAFAVCCLFVLVLPVRRVLTVPFIERPLRPPRRAYLLPPSQAPPCPA